MFASTDVRNLDQIMLDQRLQELTTVPNVQIRPWLLLGLGDFFRNIAVQPEFCEP